MRQYISLIETSLNEAIVANPSDVDTFVGHFVDKTKPDEGKQWFAKKLRNYILNDENVLTPLDQNHLSRLPKATVPDYVMAAVEAGQQVFGWDVKKHAAQDMADKAEHIVDWFNALDQVANGPATNPVQIEDKTIATKELSKLMKYNFDVALTTANAWFAHMGTRSRGASKDGVKIVDDLGNGYYVIEYTSEDTMRRDGAELQNCLSNAYYWSDVKNGRMQVFTIRKPNDEAVVAIRFRGDSLEEVKGKQNKPPVSTYVPYVIKFLNSFKDSGEKIELKGWGAIGDLRKAGIYTATRDGKIMFGALSDFQFDKDGITVAETDQLIVLQKGDVIVSYKPDTPSQQFELNEAARKEYQTTIDLLNDATKKRIIPNPPNGLAVEWEGLPYNIADFGDHPMIYWFEGVYGTVDQFGTPMALPKGLKGSVFGQSPSEKGRSVGTVIVSKDKAPLVMLKWKGGNIAFLSVYGRGYSPYMTDICNAIGLPPSTAIETNLRRMDIFYGGKYGTLKQLGKKVLSVHDGVLYQIGDRETYILIDGLDNHIPISMRNKALNVQGLLNARWSTSNPQGMRQLMRFFATKGVESLSNANVSKAPGTTDTSILRFGYFSGENGPIMTMEQFVEWFVNDQPGDTYFPFNSENLAEFLMYRKKELTPEMAQRMIDANGSASELRVEPYGRHVTLRVDDRLYTIFKLLRIKVPAVVLSRFEEAVSKAKDRVANEDREVMAYVGSRMVNSQISNAFDALVNAHNTKIRRANA